MGFIPTGGGGGSAGAVTLLSTTTLAVDGTFDVSGIAATFNDLLLVCVCRGTRVASTTDVMVLRLNNDSAANYYREQNLTSSSANTPTEQIGGTSMQVGTIPASTAPANVFGFSVISLYGYVFTTWQKTCLFDAWSAAALSTTNLSTTHGAGQWASTAAVNRVQMFGATTSNLLTGSQLRIYGVL